MIAAYTVLAAIAVGILFCVLCAVTIGLSIVRERRETRQHDIDRAAQARLFDVLLTDDPDWAGFLEDVNRAERDTLERLLNRLLRELRGRDRQGLLALAREMGLGERAEREMVRGGTVDRQIAMTWLALLDQPISAGAILRVAAEDSRLREAGARIFYERRDDFVVPGEWGTRLLLPETEEVLSVQGVETLFRLNRAGAVPILDIGHSRAVNWGADLTVQVLAVLSRCQIPQPDERMAWVMGLSAHEDANVRAATTQVFKRLGWNDAVRERVPLEQLLMDSSPLVRRGAYRMLADWPEAHARDSLVRAARREDHPRALLELTRSLVDFDVTRTEVPALPESTWAWVQAERDSLSTTTVASLSATREVEA